ncbi:MAG: ABC transporter permease, partial [Oscillospiraceae bacterium]|nr:ABC transporter permease [Oscillospiraceae bacterium]
MNIFKLTTKNLLGKKGRLLFTLLGIAVAVASFVALMSLGGNMRSQVTAQANAMGANLVIMPDGICVFNQIAVITGERISETIAFEEYERISQISGLAVIPHLTQTAAIRDVEAVVTGILPEQTLAFRDWRMLGGEYFASQDEQGVVVIGADFAQRREIAIGDTLTIRRQDFVVKGILANSASNDDFALFMPLAVAQELFGREGVIS